MFHYLIPVLCLFFLGPLSAVGYEKSQSLEDQAQNPELQQENQANREVAARRAINRRDVNRRVAYSQYQSGFSVGFVYHLGSEIESTDQRMEILMVERRMLEGKMSTILLKINMNLIVPPLV